MIRALWLSLASYAETPPFGWLLPVLALFTIVYLLLRIADHVGPATLFAPKAGPEVTVHPEILDEARRQEGIAAIFRESPSLSGPAAKGLDRHQLDNLVRMGDRRVHR